MVMHWQVCAMPETLSSLGQVLCCCACQTARCYKLVRCLRCLPSLAWLCMQHRKTLQSHYILAAQPGGQLGSSCKPGWASNSCTSYASPVSPWGAVQVSRSLLREVPTLHPPCTVSCTQKLSGVHTAKGTEDFQDSNTECTAGSCGRLPCSFGEAVQHHAPEGAGDPALEPARGSAAVRGTNCKPDAIMLDLPDTALLDVRC